mmetsp:Transcript_26244/g.62079  ORF Transcript_26244/g.62079 Transcript_26244/m.62079 type:complete len:431 (+) Transcript_26244:200-1492(+)
MRVRPLNSLETMVAKKCRPSPSTSRCAQGRPAAMKSRTCCGVGSAITGPSGKPVILGRVPAAGLRRPANPGSGTDLVAALEQREGQPGGNHEAARHHAEAQPGRHVADAEEAAPEAVDHVEERVQMAHAQPERGQRVHRVENAGQEGHRHDDEVLEGGELVELLGPQPGDQAQRAHQPGTEHGEHQHPQQVVQARRREPGRHQQHTQAHGHAAHDGRAHIGHEPGQGRQRRQQQEDQVAGDLALDQAGRAVGERVLQHAHHHEARDQEAGVADRVVDLDVILQRVPEDQQVHAGGEHRRRHGLEADLPEAQHFLLEQGGGAVHAASPCMMLRNTSSRSARPISRSSTGTPAARSVARVVSTSAASCAVTCTMRPVKRARAATSAGRAASVLKRSMVCAVPASSCEVLSSATMRPAFSMPIRWHSASASSR